MCLSDCVLQKGRSSWPINFPAEVAKIVKVKDVQALISTQRQRLPPLSCLAVVMELIKVSLGFI